MPSRGQICDKWHRYCVDCGQKSHVNQTRDGCPNGCGMGTMTRDKTKVDPKGDLANSGFQKLKDEQDGGLR